MPHDRVDAFAYAFRLSDEFLGFENEEVRLVSRLAALTIDHPMSEAERLDALKDLTDEQIRDRIGAFRRLSHFEYEEAELGNAAA